MINPVDPNAQNVRLYPNQPQTKNQVIGVENFNVKGMVKSHNLAKAIRQVGAGMFLTMLKYKAEQTGKIHQCSYQLGNLLGRKLLLSSLIQ
ncbi:MAG: hypothetical protein P3X23_003570 [Thermosynechococcus sp. Uc]|nr:hypothetical protein [Thermosynechococcus sp. Uc]MDM7326187.1 hypothetical protein [Thermosynechococcus sp. Uc]